MALTNLTSLLNAQISSILIGSLLISLMYNTIQHNF